MNHNGISKKRLKYIKKKLKNKKTKRKIKGGTYTKIYCELPKIQGNIVNFVRCHGKFICDPFTLPKGYNVITCVGIGNLALRSQNIEHNLYKYLVKIKFDILKMYDIPNRKLIPGKIYTKEHYSYKTQQIIQWLKSQVLRNTKKEINRLKLKIRQNQQLNINNFLSHKDRFFRNRIQKLQLIKNLSMVGFYEFRAHIGDGIMKINNNLMFTKPNDIFKSGELKPRNIKDDREFSEIQHNIYKLNEDVDPKIFESNITLKEYLEIKNPGTYMFRYCRGVDKATISKKNLEIACEISREQNIDFLDRENICDKEGCNESKLLFYCPGCSLNFCNRHYNFRENISLEHECEQNCFECINEGVIEKGIVECQEKCCQKLKYKYLCLHHYGIHFFSN